jgi:para-nitrobenzyl esterase
MMSAIMKPIGMLLLTGAGLAALGAPAVKVEQGTLRGASGRHPEVRVFKGVPYAAPPVGDARWKAPKPPQAWTGVRDATRFSAACVQAAYPKSSLYYRDPEPQSEDCLYLNIWTAAKSARERRPVMVWIHGGGLTRGSGSVATYDGENLARQGVVLVTINYRLNVFGFFGHPELTSESDRNSTGNYGLLDQAAALEWVQRNIDRFGGDPKRVTIFGESAGSTSVSTLMASPLARGLFHRAIGESGGAVRPMPKREELEKEGARFANGRRLADLRKLDARELLQAAEGFSFRPVVDGWFLPVDVATALRTGRHNDVPLLVGFNADEATALSPWPANANAAWFEKQSRTRYGQFADEFLKMYPAENDEQAKRSYYASTTASGMGWSMRTWARLASGSGRQPVFHYYFTRVPGTPAGEKYGAYHAAEIAYVFANLPEGAGEADRALSQVMSAYWVNFAATGNPNGKGLPHWPPYDAASDRTQILDTKVETQTGVLKDALDFFDRVAAARGTTP